MTPRRIAVWRLHSQHLAGWRPPDPASTVASMLAIQAENPSQSAWAVATRTAPPAVPPSAGEVVPKPLSENDIGHSLDAGEFLRTHVIRPTWHYVHPDDIRWLIEVTAPGVRRPFAYQAQTLGLDSTTLTRALDVVLNALAEAHLTRAQLGERLAAQGLPSAGQPLMLVMGLAEQDQLVCSGVRQGSTQTYALLHQRAPTARRLDRDQALAELALRYFTGHGPATAKDLAYWATLPLGEVSSGLAAVRDRLESFDLDGRTFWFGRPEPDPRIDHPAPRAHLLQLLDEYYRGYQDSRWMLDADGLLTPGREPAVGMLVIDGQVVGRMRRAVTARAVRFDVELLRPIRDDERDATERAARRYGAFVEREVDLRLTS